MLQLPPVARFRNGRIRPDRLNLSGCRELWPENEYPKSECALLAETGPLPGVRPMMRMPWQDALEMADAVVETEVEMSGNRKPVLWMPFMRRPLRNRVRPQVVEQTLF